MGWTFPRRATALMAALTAASLLVAGCANKAEDAGRDLGKLSQMTMATGSTGGTYFPLGGGIAQLWTNEIKGLRVTTQATGASVENVRLLNGGEVELIMSTNGVGMMALAGDGEFKGEKHDFVALGNIYPEVLQIVATESSGIKTVEDMKGKRIALGPPGSGTEVTAKQVLSHYGLDPAKDVRPFSDTFADAASKLQDGVIDAAFTVLSMPAAAILDVATSSKIHIVDITGPNLDKLLKEDPSFSTLEIPANTYPGQTKPVQTVTNWATLYALPGLDEEQVYQLVKTLYE
ncbi:MAG: TAXI family TRAP transporter solute-binding subunit, partial [Micromonosporaceae bacterium]